MAHDVGFYEYDPKKDDINKVGNTIGFFFGYAGGIFYEAFDADELDGGVSGINRGVARTAEQVRQAIETIKQSKVFKTYPDPRRISMILDTLEQYLQQHPQGMMYIHFS